MSTYSNIPFAFAALLLLSAGTAPADVRLPAVIGSHMVLQQDIPIPIWGWAEPGEKITVTLGNAASTTDAGPDGRWMVRLEKMAAGGPHQITVQGKNTLTLDDVLVGEVWLCSGQSNMEWSVSGSLNAQQEIAQAKFPQIRLFHVPKIPKAKPVDDVQAVWKVCGPDTIGSFSAVAFFFARSVHQDLGKPIGLINSSWGGTAIEPWTPPEGFASVPALANYLASRPDPREQHQKALQAFFINVEKKINEHLPKKPQKDEEEIEGTEDTADEKKEDAGTPVPTDPELPNAQKIQTWLPQAKEAAAAAKPLPAFAGGWPRGWPPIPQDPQNNPGVPTALYNGMIHPLAPFALRGALWYQGEANRGQGMRYHEHMKALIAGWRKVWGQGDFHFLYVQLAPYRYGNDPLLLPELWEAQTATLAVPNTGMAVITDIGNVADIHPRNKQEVGRRLSLWALAKVYGKTDLVYFGPLYKSMKIEGNKIRIEFDHVGSGLASRESKPLTHFIIAGEDRKFVPASAEIDSGTVVLWAEGIDSPQAVRFAWHEEAEPNLMNREGLPASPFRTDRWERPPKK